MRTEMAESQLRVSIASRIMGSLTAMEHEIETQLRREFGAFLIVGTFNTLLDFLLFNLLIAVIGLPRIPANVVSVGTVLIISFVLNGRVVFRMLPNRSLERFVRFVGITAFSGFVIQNVVIFATGKIGIEDCVVRTLGLSNFLAQCAGANLNKVLAVGTGMIWNFLA